MKFSILHAKPLYDALNQCKPIRAEESSNPALELVEMTVTESHLIITALNGFMAVQKLLPITDAEPGSCIVDPEMVMDAVGKGKTSVDFWMEDNILVCSRHGTKSMILTYTDSIYLDLTNIWPSPKSPFDIHFNIDYLITTLKSFKEKGNTCVSLQLDSSDNTKPMALSLPSGSKALVLPIRKHATN